MTHTNVKRIFFVLTENFFSEIFSIRLNFFQRFSVKFSVHPFNPIANWAQAIAWNYESGVKMSNSTPVKP
jgi:hypothetical protein